MRRSLLLLALLASVLAACGGGGGDLEGFEPGADLTTVDYLGTEFAFDPEDVTVNSGVISVTLGNDGSTRHTLLIEGHEDEMKLDAKPGQIVDGEIGLESGTYTVYCDIAGHREAGMHTTLTVE